MKMIIKAMSGEKEYDIVLEKNSLKKVGELLNLKRKVLIVTDSGVPEKYIRTVCAQCASPITVTVEQGEKSKSFDNLQKILSAMVSTDFTRQDCVVAVGGGVVGDLAGFAASMYMRGIDFYNIPTTLLSQVDSSIGGKTAVDFNGIKNIVGAFYQPKKVIIDTEVLKTLPIRQVNNGLAEAVKMALTSDKELFEIFETRDPYKCLDTIIEKSLRIKNSVVTQDEKEAGLRRVLNFGHTIGHGIEALDLDGGYLHGECVALGMIPMCTTNVRNRLIKVLKKLNLPTDIKADNRRICYMMKHDKKMSVNGITVVLVKEIGSFCFSKMTLEKLTTSLLLITREDKTNEPD